MSFNASSLALQLPALQAERHLRLASPAPMYTTQWYASRILTTTAHDWWEGGVPPARGRRQRAANAVAHAAVGMARRLHVVRSAAQT